MCRGPGRTPLEMGRRSPLEMCSSHVRQGGLLLLVPPAAATWCPLGGRRYVRLPSRSCFQFLNCEKIFILVERHWVMPRISCGRFLLWPLMNNKVYIFIIWYFILNNCRSIILAQIRPIVCYVITQNKRGYWFGLQWIQSTSTKEIAHCYDWQDILL